MKKRVGVMTYSFFVGGLAVVSKRLDHHQNNHSDKNKYRNFVKPSPINVCFVGWVMNEFFAKMSAGKMING